MDSDFSHFNRVPLEVVDGIPVFSRADRYTDNYAKISADHLRVMEQGAGNPFMEEQLWKDLENSTRELIQKYVPAGRRVLDVGVGLGRVLGPLTHLERHGIDISHGYLQNARQQGFRVAYARIEDMPYPDAFFDAVVACDVLEHVFDYYTCTQQLLRVLKPGGTLIIRVPYLDDLEAYLDESIPYEFIHVRAFDVPALRLHFSKILGMHYQEHSFVAPYPKDGLFKIKLFPKSSKLAAMAREALDVDHPLYPLRQIASMSHEDYRLWLYGLRDRDPTLCQQLLPELVHALEVNIVFTKPLSEHAAH